MITTTATTETCLKYCRDEIGGYLSELAQHYEHESAKSVCFSIGTTDTGERTYSLKAARDAGKAAAYRDVLAHTNIVFGRYLDGTQGREVNHEDTESEKKENV